LIGLVLREKALFFPAKNASIEKPTIIIDD